MGRVMPGGARRNAVDAALDLVAGAARPGEPADEVRRIRVASVLSAVLALQLAFFAVWVVIAYGLTASIAITSFGTATFLGTWLAARRWRRPALSGLVICLAINAICAATALYEDGANVLTIPFSIGLPILGMYLAGRRAGWGLTMLLMVELVVENRMRMAGFSFGRLNPAGSESGPSTLMVNLLGVAGLGVVGWLHSLERGKALETVAASEANLLSVLESTTDLVVSTDRDLNVVVANRAFVKGHQARHGRTPVPGQPLPIPAEHQEWIEHIPEALAGQRSRFLEHFHWKGRERWTEINFNPIRSRAGEVVGITAFCRDITERKEAEARMDQMHRELLTASRQAGMAEVATGVLHNVGNALNSVNVSAQMLEEKLSASALTSLGKAAALALAHRGDGAFWSGDPKGLQLPAFIDAAVAALQGQREEAVKEVRSIRDGLEHIKAVVAMQQGFARSSGVTQQVEPGELLEDALRLDSGAFERAGIRLRRDLRAPGSMNVDRHRVLQILLNLLSNARHAVMAVDRPDRQIVLRSAEAGPELVRFEVQDNGVGIAPENLERIFRQGFTTKQGGHGFGLHASANAARELGGLLTCASAGPGTGAIFTLELPRSPQARSQERQEAA